MKLSETDVKKIAHLARLKLKDEKLNDYIEDLNQIIEFVEHMQTAATYEIEPLANPHDSKLRLRADEITGINLQDKYQHMAPRMENGLFLVPKVIE